MAEGRPRGLFIYKVVSGVLEEAALAAVFLWLLPRMAVDVPIWVLPPAMLALAAYNVFMYRKTVQALRTKPIPGLPDMTGTLGEAIGRLAPTGQVKIGGELWQAEAESGEMPRGRKVVVVRQNGLRLIVREADEALPRGAE
jgi:membrane-bound ClpP family serine protease